LHQTGTTTLDGASYSYDSAGNRTAKTNLLNNVAEQYSYDAIYQLTQVVQGATTTESYSYDAVGNRLSSLGMSPYAYNSSNQLGSMPGVTFTYDGNGNTLTKVNSSGTTQYVWDFENRLSSVVLPGAGGTVAFKYDPFGRRVQKSSAAGTTNYLYDGRNSVEEVDPTGALLARYAQGAGIDEPLGEVRGGSAGFYEQDGLGSVTSLSGSTGALVNTYAYDSFGVVTASTGTMGNPFQYTGRDYDSETGLRYYRARYYDPATGRFLGEDPTGFEGGINFYAYTLNNPINLRDPSGNSAGAVAIPVAQGIGTVVCFGSGVCETVIVVGGVVVGVAATGYLIYHYLSNSKTNDDADARSKKKPSPCKKDPCQGLRLQLIAHQAKLAAYASNPYASDNLGILGRGYDDRIIAGRVKHLVQEILELQKQLEECEHLNGLR
jgi:RHS repeat-associated protein